MRIVSKECCTPRRAIGRGRACLRAGAGDGSRFGDRPWLRRLQCCLSRQRRPCAAGDRACDAPRPSRSAAQHLVLFWRFCRAARRPHRRVDRPAPRNLWNAIDSYGSARLFLMARLSLSGRPRSGRGRGVVSAAISRLARRAFEQLWLSRSTIADLSRPDSSAVRERIGSELSGAAILISPHSSRRLRLCRIPGDDSSHRAQSNKIYQKRRFSDAGSDSLLTAMRLICSLAEWRL